MQTCLCLTELPEQITQWGLGGKERGKGKMAADNQLQDCAGSAWQGAGDGGDLHSVTDPVSRYSSCRPAEQVSSPRTTPSCRWPHAPAAPLPPPAEGRRSSRQKPRVPPTRPS